MSKKGKITSSVMLWTLRGGIEEKLETAARAGIESVELTGEYAVWSDFDLARYKKLTRSFRLTTDALLATPDWKKRPVSMVNPAHREAFLADVNRAIEIARRLDAPQIILMSGDEVADMPRGGQWASLVEGARRAGDLAARGGVTAIVEPLNAKVDHPGFFLTTCADGLRLVKEAGHPHVRLLFDLYHEQVQAGDVTRAAVEAAPYVAVYHVAGNPGRQDPDAGEMNYPSIYKAIAEAGFSGYIAMEYQPRGGEAASLIKAVDNLRAALV